MKRGRKREGREINKYLERAKNTVQSEWKINYMFSSFALKDLSPLTLYKHNRQIFGLIEKKIFGLIEERRILDLLSDIGDKELFKEIPDPAL